MQLTLKSINEDKEAFAKASVKLPSYDVASLAKKTLAQPVWIHMGSGNIFYAFIAAIAQKLINAGDLHTGIMALELHSDEHLNKIVLPHDHLRLNVTLMPDTSVELEVLGSVTQNLLINGQKKEDEKILRNAVRSPSLQLISYTITEKGYALKDIHGNFLKEVEEDFLNGPAHPHTAAAWTCALLWERFKANAAPLALVSMDNCSHNGDKLKEAVLQTAAQWLKQGFVTPEFLAYLEDEKKVSFPWTMIDKITPRPDPAVASKLAALGLLGMDPVKTSRGTFLAPFVNAEKPQYLVIEDKFPNGHPPLEKTGVLFTTGEKVDLCERMKVTTCLNPLHTALAVYGCILGYTRIYQETDDPELTALIKKLGYDEGLPVVEDPKILDPRKFIDEVINVRLPNRCLPDSPQRIATDTSLKIPVRFGQTVKSYMGRSLPLSDLTALPLTIAGYLRYLMAVDDDGKIFELSDDPRNDELKKIMQGIEFGKPQSVGDKLHPILANAELFGADLYAAGIGHKIEKLFQEEIAGPKAVRNTLKKYL